MIDKGADVLYAERFGVSDAAKEKGKLAIGNVINTQDKYPDTVVASALWNMEPTIDRAIKAVKDGKFKAEDYGPYSMMKHKGSRARAARHVREEGAGRHRGQGQGQGEGRSSTASSPSRSTTPSPSRRRSDAPQPALGGTRSRTAASAAGPAPSRGHHQALRRAGRQRRDLARAARGEVLALLGENGAGKSTLVSILFGHYVADAGTIEVFGQPLPPGDPTAALAAGIGMVHQHFTLADNLSVLDNVMLGTEPLWQPFSRRARGARAGCSTTAQRFGLRGGPGRARRRAVGRRAPARRDPEGALPRRAHPDPRRADRGADAAGERGAVRHAAADGGAGPVDHLHQPQARRGAARVATASRCCAPASWSRRCAGARHDAGAARRVDGRPRGARRRCARAARRRGDAVCALDARRTRGERGASGSTTCRSRCAPARSSAIAGVSGNGQQALAELLCGMRARRRAAR